MNEISEMLDSIKVDLLSRRLLPLLVVSTLVFLGAVAYAAMSAGSTSTPPPPAPSSPPAASSAGTVPVSVAPENPNEASAETPGGKRFQTKAPERDPFLPLAGVAKGNASGANGASSKSSSGEAASNGAKSGGSNAGPTTGGAAPSGPRQPPTPAKPAPPKPVYSVSALFGLAPAEPGAQPTLTPYENLERLQPLPSASGPLLVFLGVSASGKGAVFALDVPPILRGAGKCLPSTTQCQALELMAGQTEELEYLDPSGQVFTFQLQVVGIVKKSTPSSAADAIYKRSSKAGLQALERANLAVMDRLRFSLTKGVLVYTAPRHR